MKTASIFILGILIGIGISIFGEIYLDKKKYAILDQDYQLANGGILKEGTKIKYNASFSEGFEQYSLFLNMPRWVDNKVTIVKEKSAIIPHWIEPTSGVSELEERIIGDWGIYVSIFAGTSTYCNVCPRINFKANKTSILTLPSDQKEYYDWDLKGNTITLSFQKGDRKENYFINSIYEIEINEEEGFVELKLLVDEESGYILRK